VESRLSIDGSRRGRCPTRRKALPRFWSSTRPTGCALQRYRDGDRLVIGPVRKRGLVALLAAMAPLDEAFPEIDDPVPAPEHML